MRNKQERKQKTLYAHLLLYARNVTYQDMKAKVSQQHNMIREELCNQQAPKHGAGALLGERAWLGTAGEMLSLLSLASEKAVGRDC